jgi:hypothetical protein
MSAAAAPVRKVQNRPSAPTKAATPWWEQSDRPRDWWAKTKSSYFKELIRRVAGLVEFGIVGNIIDETEGAYPKPREWAAVTEKQFAEVLAVTEEAVHRALDELEEKKFIESRSHGRRKEYRALPDNFDQGEERVRAEKKPPQSETENKPRETPRPFQPLVLRAGLRSEPIDLGCEVTRVRCENFCTGDVAIEAAIDGGMLHLALRSHLDRAPNPDLQFGEEVANTGVPIQKPFEAKKRNTELQFGEHQANKNGANGSNPKLQFGKETAKPSRSKELREWLSPLFLQQFRKPLDEPFLTRIDESLGVATVADLQILVTESIEGMRKRGDGNKFKSGLILNLAGRAAHAAAEREKIEPPPPPAERKFRHVPFTPPAEDFDSPWARIKVRLQKRMSETAYSNWVMRTAFSSFEDGELVVYVPDHGTREFMEQEYSDDVRTAISDLDLPVVHVRYWPPEEIS